jgi:PAS domain S-box-containing protein
MQGQRFSKQMVLVIVVLVCIVVATATLVVFFGFPALSVTPAGPGSTPVRLTAEEREWIASHPGITVCPDPDYPPFELYDKEGNYSGIAADYLRIIRKNTGLQITDTRQADWNICLDMIRENRTDVLGAVFTSDLRRSYLNYTDPFYQPPLVIITRNTVSPGLEIDDLNGMTVVAVQNYTTYELLRQRYPGIRLQPVPNIRTGLQKVSFGSADAYFGDLATASWYVDREGLTNLHIAGEYTPPDPAQFQLAVGIRNNEPVLREILNKGLSTITPAERDQVIGRWVSSDLRPSAVDPRIITALLAGIGVLVLFAGIIMLWNRSLRRAVAEKTSALSRELEERRNIQESLRLSEEKYRSILENIHDVYYRSDRDGNMVMISPSGVRLFGAASPSELIGKNIARDLYANPADREVLLDAIRARGSVSDYEVLIRRMDGQVRTIATTSHIYSGPDGTPAGIEGVLRDITPRKKAEEEMVRKNEELSAAYEELTATQEELKQNYDDLRRSQQALELARNKLDLLNTVTFQDIQNAIFTISGYFELEKPLITDEKLREYREKEVRLARTVMDSLKFANYYRNIGLSPPRWQHVGQTFVLAISHLDFSAIARKVDVTGLDIYADPLLEHVFLTLAENVLLHAISATEVRLFYTETPDGLVLVFTDNGAGIPAAVKEKIFERRYEAKMGLGLFLAREILGITGITIRENGVPKEGARFELFVPKDAYRLKGSG